MADTKVDLVDLLGKLNTEVDFLREGVRVLAEALMDEEVSAQIGAEWANAPPTNARPNATDTATRAAGTPASAASTCASQATDRQILPLVPRRPPTVRAGVVRGRRPGLRRGRVHPPGR